MLLFSRYAKACHLTVLVLRHWRRGDAKWAERGRQAKGLVWKFWKFEAEESPYKLWFFVLAQQFEICTCLLPLSRSSSVICMCKDVTIPNMLQFIHVYAKELWNLEVIYWFGKMLKVSHSFLWQGANDFNKLYEII